MTYEQLVAYGIELGLTADCAAEMANEHIARRQESLPAYVASGLNSAITRQPLSARLQKFLDRKFGFNSDNTHDVYHNGKAHCTVSRNNATGLWYAC